MRRYATLGVLAVLLSSALAGCSSGSNSGYYSSSGGGSGTVGFQANPYVGSYAGSLVASPNYVSSVGITVDQYGNLTGQQTDETGNVFTLAGTISRSGSSTIDVSSGTTLSTVWTGHFGVNTAGQLEGAFVDAAGGTVLITVNTTATSTTTTTVTNEFAGTYAGTYTVSSPFSSGTAALTISTAGLVSGTLTPSSGSVITLGGTAPTSANVSLSETVNGNSTPVTGIIALTSTDPIKGVVALPSLTGAIIYATDGSGNITTLTLKKS
jgi:hypothetical protein